MHNYTFKIKILIHTIGTVILYEHIVTVCNKIVHMITFNNYSKLSRTSSVIKSFSVTLVVSVKRDFNYWSFGIEFLL